MTEKIGRSVFIDLLSLDICLTSENDQSTISSAARLNAWIYVTKVSVYDERNTGQATR